MSKWKSIKNSDGKGGVRYREHKTRKHGIIPDRYYMLTYRWKGKSTADGVGWASDGWTPGKCFRLLEEIRRNQSTGKGPCTLKEMRELAEVEKEEQRKRKDAEKSQTFSAFFEDIFLPDAETRWKPETLRKTKEHVKNWIDPVTKSTPFRELSIVHANRIKSNLSAAGSSPRTMQYVFRNFAMIWDTAADYGYTDKICPTKLKSFRLPKVDNERKRYLSRLEEEVLFRKIIARSRTAYNIAVIAVDTGMRFSEIAKLTWDCVDFSRKAIAVVDTKGKVDRYIPMTERAAETLIGIKSKSKLVFPNSKGLVMREVPSSFNRAVVDSGINKSVTNKKMRASFYTLRHTYASRLIQSGVDLYRVQRLLGHSTPIMTQRYAKLSDENLREAVNSIENGNNIIQFKKIKPATK